MIITIAWADIVRRPACDPGTVRVDIGHRVPMMDAAEPRAVVWVSAGTAADVAKAEAHAATIDGAQVFTFDTTEPDPIGRAKAMIRKGKKGVDRLGKTCDK